MTNPDLPLGSLSDAAHVRDGQLGAGAWVVDCSTRARVAVRGEDARAFLHRLSTNHVSALAAGEGRLNVLPTDKGRIVDLVHHLDRGEVGVLLVGSQGRGAELVTWLDRYLFSERVELEDVSGAGSAAEVFGARAPGMVEELVPGAGALARWAFVASGPRLAVRSFDRIDAAGAAVPLYIVVDLASPGVATAFEAKGALRMDADEAERARIAAGVPGHAGELNNRFNPLDLGLHDAIHWAKGCYIGQEVIARLDTYQKQTKRLVGLLLPAGSLGTLRPGMAVLADGAPVGEVTSVSPVMRDDVPELPRALAVVKMTSSGPTRVQVRTDDGVLEATAVLPATAQVPHS